MTSVDDILRENSHRRALLAAPFDPITGQGSVGERVPIDIPDFPIPRQWVPPAVACSPLALALRDGIGAFLADAGLDPQDPALRDRVVDAWVRLRSLHDFPFWAASFVYIKDKHPGRPDCLFRLTFPQRRYLEALEEDRLARRPIRIVMCKARQWGGSTLTQVYMAWLQLVHRPSLNSLIIAHVNSASEKIKGMFRKLLDRYPVRLLHDPAEPCDPGEKKLVWDGNSDTTQRIPQRGCTISVGSSESPNSARSGDYALAHISEIGLFKDTDKIHPADLIRSATSGILYEPYTMIVYESTADGVGTFFHQEWTAAADPDTPSQFRAFFMPWHQIELYSLDLDDERAFAARLLAQRDSADIPSPRQDSGRYNWWLWEQGATLQAINWYITERTKYSDPGKMRAEFPTDAIEAFINNGASVFDKYLVEALRRTCRPPLLVADIAPATPGSEPRPSSTGFQPVSPPTEAAPAAHPAAAATVPGDFIAGTPPPSGAPLSRRSSTVPLYGLRIVPDPCGELWVWSLPDIPAPDEPRIANRYLTVVDVGGRTSQADWSVIVVFDRLMMMHGGKPQVVAQWRGHTDIDLLAWRAAQIAAVYDNALLVIESNTIETHDRERHIEGGDQSQYILSQIKDAYPNLYARRQSEDDIRERRPAKYGFHTNSATKPMIISNLVRVVREALYTERDSRCLDEYLLYERKPSGAYGAVSGAHDDLLMTRAIGLHICFNEMDPPRLIPPKRTAPKAPAPNSLAVL